MKVLVIGSGGREHALVWKLKQSKLDPELFWAPGNGGYKGFAQCVNISAENVEDILDFCMGKKIDFVVVGPEAPLALGIVDKLNKKNIKVFGPTKAASQLEISKVFTKLFCQKNGIPSAKFWIFDDSKKVTDFLQSRELPYPLVLKADGLAAGKGVIIAEDANHAVEAANKIMVQKKFGNAGNKIVIEEFLAGNEASIMALCDGEKSLILPTARDYKRALDEDKGENTGGMGAVSPSPVVSENDKKNNLLNEIKFKIIDKTLQAMADAGNPFKGVLYAGLMLTDEGPKLLEFNVRFGDPETQVVLPRLKEDLLTILIESSEGKITKNELSLSQNKCVTVVAASKGYPSSYSKGFEIKGIKMAEENGCIVFHAGTKREGEKILTNGGRVLNVTAFGETYNEAREKVYKGLEKIDFEGITYRKDIARI